MTAAASHLLDQAHSHYRDHEWGAAHAALTDADTLEPLTIEDVVLLASTSFFLGRDDESAAAWARAQQLCLDEGDNARAARCCFWLAFGHIQRGDMAQAGGWLGTAAAMLESAPSDCAEHGYLLVPVALQSYFGGDPGTANEVFGQAGEIGRRCHDTDLVALSLFGQGQTLVALGRSAEGMEVLDELMVSVTTRQVSPSLVGLVYCGVIAACQEVFDVRRAREWTTALTRWCDAQPDLVPYRGLCLVHRSEVFQRHGEWPEAVTEADRAIEWLSRPPPHPALGAAWYGKAELHRLRGESEDAESCYRSASQWGNDVQPGLALLRLADGEIDTACSSIERALEEADEQPRRLRTLSAFVEIKLAADDVKAARRGADELETLTAGAPVPYLVAMASYASGCVLVAEGDPRAALRPLRRAWTSWRDVETPYECARARVLIGQAFQQLGDDDSAEMEFDAARWILDELGAGPALAWLGGIRQSTVGDPAPDTASGHGLTGRELEILAQLATGKTNRVIASELIISEKTVARHVANIFIKLGVSSRAAATAYAVRQGLA